MPWVRFVAAFDFKPKKGITIAYQAGYVGLVSRACAEKAKARGRAVDVCRPGVTPAQDDPSDG